MKFIKELIAFRLFVFILSIAVVGCSEKDPYAYKSKVVISGINIEVGLIHKHLFLAEYQRNILFGGKEIDFGIDSGGYEFINVFETEQKIVLQSVFSSVMVIDKSDKTYALEMRELSKEEEEHFVGKFHFVERGKYEFESHLKDPSFNARVLRGG
jgi:hypothetical protein